MATQYEITAEMVVHIPVTTANGPMLVDLYKGAVLPDGVPQERIQQLLEGNLIKEVGKDVQADKPAAKPASRSTKASEQQ